MTGFVEWNSRTHIKLMTSWTSAWTCIWYQRAMYVYHIHLVLAAARWECFLKNLHPVAERHPLGLTNANCIASLPQEDDLTPSWGLQLLCKGGPPRTPGVAELIKPEPRMSGGIKISAPSLQVELAQFNPNVHGNHLHRLSVNLKTRSKVSKNRALVFLDLPTTTPPPPSPPTPQIWGQLMARCRSFKYIAWTMYAKIQQALILNKMFASKYITLAKGRHSWSSLIKSRQNACNIF